MSLVNTTIRLEILNSSIFLKESLCILSKVPSLRFIAKIVDILLELYVFKIPSKTPTTAMNIIKAPNSTMRVLSLFFIPLSITIWSKKG